MARLPRRTLSEFSRVLMNRCIRALGSRFHHAPDHNVVEGADEIEIDRSGPMLVPYSGKYMKAGRTGPHLFRNNSQESG